MDLFFSRIQLWLALVRLCCGRKRCQRHVQGKQERGRQAAKVFM